MISDIKYSVASTEHASWLTYSVVTPARSFRRYVCERDDKVILFTVLAGSRNDSDWGCIPNLLDKLGGDTFNGLFKKLPCDGLPGGFEALLLLPFSYHDAHKEFSERLHRSTILAIPAYDCEFADEESVESVRALMRLNPAVDWGRLPSPRIKMRFEISEPKIKSTNFGFTSLVSLNNEAARLKSSPSGFIDVQNYQLRTARIDKNNYFYSSNQFSPEMLSANGPVQLLADFVLGK